MTKPTFLLLVLCLIGCSEEKQESQIIRESDDKVKRPNISIKLPPITKSEELARTKVIPHMDVKLLPGLNYVYCATFQLAWNELQDEVLKEPIELQDPSLANVLNERKFLREDLAEDSYFAIAGFVKDGIMDRLKNGMSKRFPTVKPDISPPTQETVAIAFAYLEKSLPFEEAFDELDEPLTFRDSKRATKVRSFGITDLASGSDRHNTLRSQVTVVDYVDKNNFVIKLNTRSESDELILAKMAHEDSLAKTVAAVMARSSEPTQIYKGEYLAIPIISLGITHHFTELQEQPILNAGWDKHLIGEAKQIIRFRLDRTGAQLQSEAYEDIYKSTMGIRNFVFDRPFLLYLKEKTSDQPYLAVWIENHELLESIPR